MLKPGWPGLVDRQRDGKIHVRYSSQSFFHDHPPKPGERAPKKPSLETLNLKRVTTPLRFPTLGCQKRKEFIWGKAAALPCPITAGRCQCAEMAGFFLQRLHAVTLPIWRGFAPAPLFPRATASATVPTGWESAERRGEFSFWSRRRRHVHDTPRRFQWRTLAKSGRGRMSWTPQRVAPTCASVGRG